MTHSIVVDAVVQFLENEALQLVRSLALLGINSRLRQQQLGIEFGLLQQQTKAVILSCK